MKNPLFILTAPIIISLNTICCFAGDPRFEPPVVADEFHVLNCGFAIEISAVAGVDARATEITLIDSQGNNVTNTLEIVPLTTEDTKEAIVKVQADPALGVGTYTAIITAKNIYGIASEPQIRVATIIQCDCCEYNPGCSMEPFYLYSHDKSLEIEIQSKGAFFSYDPMPDVEFSAPEITVHHVSVVDWHTLKLIISVDTISEEQFCDISIDNRQCGYILLKPYTRDTTCLDADGDGYSIPVGDEDCGPLDCDDTHASTYPGAVEIMDDGLDNDCDGLIDSDDDCGCVRHSLESILPDSVNAGIFLPRLRTVTITGDEHSAFSNNSLVDFGTDDIIVLYKNVVAGDTLKVLILVKWGATSGTYDVTIDDYDGEFTIY